MRESKEREDLESIVNTLAKHAWDNEVSWPQVSMWLDNFKGEVVTTEEEQLYALYALTRFMYFGRRLVREMLRSLYRDHFEAPLKQIIRKLNGNTNDFDLIQTLYGEELSATRFLGIGNPAESGAHLLYYFRQVNNLNKDLFSDISTAFEPQIRNNHTVAYAARNNNVRRYVFFDDLVGSGTQAEEYLGHCLPSIKLECPDSEISYMCLFGSKEGMSKVNGSSLFDGKAKCLFYLNESYKAFENESRHFKGAPDWFDLSTMKKIALHYGAKLWAEWPIGYKSGQLLLSFSHNTPDNAPPIFWKEGTYSPWAAMFMRYGKIY